MMRLAPLALALAACGGPRSPAPPAPDTRGCEPAVALALEAARAALLAAPRDGHAWGELGLVCDAHGFASEASAAYARASELDSRELRWPYLAALALAERDPSAALAFAERARELAPNDAWVELRRGQILADLGRDDPDGRARARAALEHALALDPQCIEARLALADLALTAQNAGGPERARTLLEEARARDPDNRRVLVLLARSLRLLGEDAQAQAVGARAQTLPDPAPSPDPHRATVDARGQSALHLALRAQRHLQAGELELALADFRAARAARDDLGPARVEEAQALVLAGRGAEGIALLRETLARDAEDLAAARTLAAALAATGDLAAAAEQCRLVLDRAPGDRDLVTNYVALLRRLGHEEEARAEERRFAAEDGRR